MDISDPNSHFQILVVEDEPIAKKVLVRTLNQEGYEVKSVENGVQAIRLERGFAPVKRIAELFGSGAGC